MIYEHLEDVSGIERIIPEKYIWHTTLKINRSEILAFGLRPDLSKHKCVFANNQSFKILFMYPFSVETYEGTFKSSNLLDYDYWRIDTASLQADWYIDSNMKNGPIRYMGDKKYFVVTEAPIPAEAMELFEVGKGFIMPMWYVQLYGIEKSTGYIEEMCLYGRNNLDIKKEISEIRETHDDVETSTTRYISVENEKFPLVKVQ